MIIPFMTLQFWRDMLLKNNYLVDVHVFEEDEYCKLTGLSSLNDKIVLELYFDKDGNIEDITVEYHNGKEYETILDRENPDDYLLIDSIIGYSKTRTIL